MASLAEIRKKLQEQENRSSGSSNYDNTIYPHWNIQEGESTKVRFLPDGDETNTFFWIERLLINLPFPGVKGDPTSKPVTVKVPCMEMWEPVGSCPILSEVRPWFKDPTLEDLARKYWKKRSYLMQGFVRENPLEEDKENAPANPIRRFIFTPQIFEIVKAALMDPELEELPTDYEAGLDFIINKTSGSQFANYTTSKYARKESPLSVEELEAIEKYGLFDLKSFLPEKPDAAHLQAIKEMFEASVDGEPYDPARWGQFYAPPGVEVPKQPAATTTASTSTAVASTEAATEAATEAPAQAETVTEAPAQAVAKETVTEQPTASASTSDEDERAARTRAIMERIKNRTAS